MRGMRSVLYPSLIFVASAATNVSTEVQKAERMAPLYHALHGSQMPKVKCNQWVWLFHSSLWLRHKQRVNPSLLLTGSLPVRKAKCQREKETGERGWERMRMRSEVDGSSVYLVKNCYEIWCWLKSLGFSSVIHTYTSYIPTLPFSQWSYWVTTSITLMTTQACQ